MPMRLRRRTRATAGFAAMCVPIVGLVVGVTTPAAASPDGIFKSPSGDPASIAHRGASGQAPENTIAAFELAIEQRADFIELDIQRSADGELVVFHDPHNLDRTTNVRDVFPDRRFDQPGTFTLAELRRLDAGSWNDEEFAGERIPTLEEFLDTMRPPTGLILELKNPSRYPGVERQLARELDASDSEYVTWARARGRLTVASIDHEAAERYHELRPNALVGALATPSDTSDGELREIAGFADFIGTGEPTFSRARIERIHGFGLEALTNTSTAAAMDTMIDRGIDGAITDYPERMNDAVADRSPHFIEAEDLLPPVEATAPVDDRDNCCMRGGKWSGDAELRLRGDQPGDLVTVEFEVPEAGTYDLSVVRGKGKNYGVSQLLIDGAAVGDPYDGYRISVVRETVDYGRFAFEQGEHTLSLEIVGQHSDSGGHYASIDVLELERVGRRPSR